MYVLVYALKHKCFSTLLCLFINVCNLDNILHIIDFYIFYWLYYIIFRMYIKLCQFSCNVLVNICM
uniref:Uncharacterized protein n=1 Tax=Anguilla anguilla TaxID=7936 RepID=A0A0E9TJP9_ANGAN